jgi:hypothetical protein
MSDNLNHGLVDQLTGDRNFNSSKWTSAPIQGFENDYVIEGTAVGGLLSLELNTDATVNYREYYMRGVGGSPSAFVDDTVSLPVVLGSTDTAKPSAFRIIITSNEATEKFINSFASISGGVYVKAIYWKNTLDEPISISLYDTVSRVTTVDFRLYQIPKTANLDNYDLVDEVVFENRSTDIVFDNLDGDVDEEYLIISNLDLIGSEYFEVHLNSGGGFLSTSNVEQGLWNLSGSIQAGGGASSRDGILINGHGRFFVKSGKDRLINVSYNRNQAVGYVQNEITTWNSNQLDNVDGITLIPQLAPTGKISLYKRKSNKTIDPVPMTTVVEYDVDGDFSAGITVSDINGDSIRGAIKIEWVGGAIGVSSIDCIINGDSSSNYDLQNLAGISNSTYAAAFTLPFIRVVAIDTVDTPSSGVIHLYPKSGQNKPSLCEYSMNKTEVGFFYQTWNNDLDEVNQITIFSPSSVTIKGKIRISTPTISAEEAGAFTVVTN